MRQATHTLTVVTRATGPTLLTHEVETWVTETGITTGLLTLQIQHTSASLLIQENASPDVMDDFERFFQKVAPWGDAMWSHDAEGRDDMPAHIRSAITSTSLSIPVVDGRPALGTWQGIFLYEHRERGHRRRIVAHLIGE